MAPAAPISTGTGTIRDLVENDIDDFSNVLCEQMRILLCDAQNQFRFDHAIPPPGRRVARRGSGRQAPLRRKKPHPEQAGLKRGSCQCEAPGLKPHSSNALLPDRFRRIGKFGGDPPRFVAGQQLGRRPAAGLIDVFRALVTLRYQYI